VNNLSLIEKYFSGSSVDEIYHNLTTSMDNSDWVKQQVNALKTKSPTSLKVVFKELKYGETTNLYECLITELRVALHFMLSHDFCEGVRAVIVEKDYKPNWTPSQINEVTNNIVDEFFSLGGIS